MTQRSPLAVLFLTVFLDLLGFGLIIPLQPLFAEHLGASGLEVGLLMTSYSAMQFVFAPVWGRISDRVGRRPVLLVSIAASVLAMLLFASARELWVLFVARTFAGIANANLGTAQAYIADVTPPEKRARGMGMIGAAFGMGFVLGPALGGLLAHFGWTAPALGAAALSFVNLVLAWFLLPESLPKEQRARAAARRTSRLATFRESLSHPLLPFLFALFFLTTLGFSQLEATFGLYTLKRFGFGVAENGYLFGFIGVILALVQGGLIHPLQKRFGEPALLVGGTALLAAGLFFVPVADGLPGLLAALGVLALGHGVQAPALSSLVSKQAEPHRLGGVLGANQSMGSLARILGPIAAGSLFDLAGESAPFHVAGAVLVVSVALTLVILVRRPRVAEAAPSPELAAPPKANAGSR
jgi:DHA1 family tetracycline resistance protein-like MFS transporter